MKNKNALIKHTKILKIKRHMIPEEYKLIFRVEFANKNWKLMSFRKGVVKKKNYALYTQMGRG